MLWCLSFLAFFYATSHLAKEFPLAGLVRQEGRTLQQLKVYHDVLFELQSSLEAGLVPRPDQWEQLRFWKAPWGSLAYESMVELRKQGVAIIPTLKRLRELLTETIERIRVSRSKAAQGFTQALLALVLIPLVGFFLFYMLPPLQLEKKTWWSSVGIATAVGVLGVFWVFHIVEKARWGGLKGSQRSWVLLVTCAGERFLAFVRSGSPPDIAWVKTIQMLSGESIELAENLGAEIWQTRTISTSTEGKRPLSLVLVEAFGSIRKAVQVSLMEGVACGEKVEGALLSLRQQIRTRVEYELSLIPLRILKPLFLCMAPPVLGLIFYSLYLCSEQWLEAS